MPDKSSFFRKWVGTMSAAGLLLLGIINSSFLSEVQKYFAGTLVMLLLFIFYAESTYEKRDRKKAVKGGKPKGGENDV